jgi:hypothetical protein
MTPIRWKSLLILAKSLSRAAAAASLLAAMCSLNAAGAANPSSRPILFVHGFCGSDSDFAPLLGPLYSQLNKTSYPSSTLYYVQYNSRTNETTFFSSSTGETVEESAIASSTRFFSIEFYDPVSESSNPVDVEKISILNKGYEISQAVAHITAITHIKDVILVAHSVGGVSARSYIESMASAGACYDYQANTPNYSLHTCMPGEGEAKFWDDVGDVVTLDAPNAGTPLDTFNLAPYASFIGACIADGSVNRAEMNPQKFGGPGLLEALNYNGSELGGAKPEKNVTPIQAVEDYFIGVTNPWTNLNGNFTGLSDDIVQLTSQSITKNLPAVQSIAKLTDVPVGYAPDDKGIADTSGCWIDVPFYGNEPLLHFMACLGAQPDTQNAVARQVAANTRGTLTSIGVEATLDGKPWAGAVRYRLRGPSGATSHTSVPATTDDLPLGAYSVAYASGGPKAVRAPSVAATPSDTLQRGQWSAIFTLAFASKNPTAKTEAAEAITDDGATLTGSVNPEGQPGKAFFEWSTSATMSPQKIACESGEVKNCHAATVNYAAQSITASITTAPKNTKIYFRAVFYDTASKTYTYGVIGRFTTKTQ